MLIKSIIKFPCVYFRLLQSTFANKYSTTINVTSKQPRGVPTYLKLQNDWPEAERINLENDMMVIEDFLTEKEEAQLLEEVEPYLKRMRYEFDHWDDAIHGFRETERNKWYPHNKITIQRVSDFAFGGEIMPYIHVLDLAEDGVIKPHVDSTRYCGSTIAGLSLLSDSMMRLVRIDEKKYAQSDDSYRHQSTSEDLDNAVNFYADVLLKRRSLYVMKDTARYNFTHEIIGNGKAVFNQLPIVKTRRISIICRNNP